MRSVNKCGTLRISSTWPDSRQTWRCSKRGCPKMEIIWTHTILIIAGGAHVLAAPTVTRPVSTVYWSLLVIQIWLIGFWLAISIAKSASGVDYSGCAWMCTDVHDLWMGSPKFREVGGTWHNFPDAALQTLETATASALLQGGSLDM